MGLTDDGDRLYYWMDRNGGGVFVWNQGDTRLIANDISPKADLFSVARVSAPGRRAHMTANGNYLAFIDGLSEPMDRPTNNGRMYLYNFRNDSLICVSCDGGFATTIEPAVARASVESTNSSMEPRFLASDGRLFFSTAGALVPEDVNATWDAYQYDPASGNITLLSTGRGGEKSAFADAGESGNNVFIVTRQSLVAGDSDELVDLYNVRTLGGYPESAELVPPPCDGEACQGSIGPSPGAVDSASQTPKKGNVASRSRCRKHGRGKPASPGKKRCIKHKGKHRQQRSANANRRTHR